MGGEFDVIGPLGPRPPVGEIIETGRYPVLIDGKTIIELEADGETVRETYSYAKPETGDKADD